MKKIILLIILCVCIANTYAQAASHTTHTDTLKELGVFRGTDTGYELDATATRAQAAVMLVRLLGQEANATAAPQKHPFTDVPDWADAAVGYLYANKLTNGTGAKTFSPNDKCTAQMYATFALRSLGYSDTNGDFAYADALKFGAEKAVVNDALAAGEFTRDKMVAISYNALLANVKSGGGTLLAKLNADGVVNKDAADKLLAQYATLTEFNSAYTSAMTKLANVEKFATEASVSGSGTLTVGAKDSKVTLTAARKLNVAADLQMSLEVATKIDADETYRRVFAKDGATYFSLPVGGGQSQNFKITTGSSQNTQTATALPNEIQPDVTKEAKDGNTIYTLTVSGVVEENPAILQYLDSLIAFPDVTVKSAAVKISYTFDKDGALVSTVKKGSIVAEVNQSGTVGKLSLNFDSTEQMTSSVTIEFPSDLNTYADVTNRVSGGTSAA